MRLEIFRFSKSSSGPFYILYHAVRGTRGYHGSLVEVSQMIAFVKPRGDFPDVLRRSRCQRLRTLF